MGKPKDLQSRKKSYFFENSRLFSVFQTVIFFFFRSDKINDDASELSLIVTQMLLLVSELPLTLNDLKASFHCYMSASNEILS